jgi:hypothetical protein
MVRLQLPMASMDVKISRDKYSPEQLWPLGRQATLYHASLVRQQHILIPKFCPDIDSKRWRFFVREEHIGPLRPSWAWALLINKPSFHLNWGRKRAITPINMGNRAAFFYGKFCSLSLPYVLSTELTRDHHRHLSTSYLPAPNCLS